MSTDAIGTLPEPGLYYHVPPADYFAWPAEHSTRLRAILTSPAHYAAAEGREETAAQRLGTLAHCLGLEPLAALERYVVLPDFTAEVRDAKGNRPRSPRSTAEYRQRVAAFEAQHADKTIVSAADYAQAAGMCRALHANATARRLLGEARGTEVSLAWIDAETGIACKARVDLLGDGMFCDLKTIADITRIGPQSARFGYRVQAAMYREGLRTTLGEAVVPWWMFVASERPFCVQAAPVGLATLTQGAAEFHAALRRVAECRETNEWPGPVTPEQFEDPAWSLPEFQFES